MDQVTRVYKAIAAVSADLAQQGIAKNRRNQQQNYQFRGIDDVLNALAPSLTKHGLVILPRILSRQCAERESKSGGTLFSVVVEAAFDFVAAEDGSYHTVQTFGEGMDSADKATNKAMSAAYKYAAFMAFCIPVEGMAEDADSVTPDPAPKANQARPAPPTRDEPPHPASESHAAPEGDGWRRVAELKAAKRGTSAKGPWTLWIAKFEDGSECKTFDDGLAEHLQIAKREHVPVIVSAKPDGTLTNVIRQNA